MRINEDLIQFSPIRRTTLVWIEVVRHLSVHCAQLNHSPAESFTRLFALNFARQQSNVPKES